MKRVESEREEITLAVRKAIISSTVDAVVRNDLHGKAAEIFVLDAAFKSSLNTAYLLNGTKFSVSETTGMYFKILHGIEAVTSDKNGSKAV